MSGSCTGSASGGTYVSLMAKGAANSYIDLGATATFWRNRYNKHTNFAMEAIEQNFNTQVGFGQCTQVVLNRTGDLAYWMYAVIRLPGICACQATPGICGLGGSQYPYCSTCDPTGDGPAPDNCNPGGDDEETPASCSGLDGDYAHYTNAVGQFLIKKAHIVIGSHMIDTLSNDFLYIWEELSGKPGKRLEEMIGKRWTTAQLVLESSEDRTLYVPLPFWFTVSSGNALPLVSLQFNTVQIHIEFASLRECIQVSGPGIMVVKSRDQMPLTANDLLARIETTYVYVDIDERDRFATGSFEQLITQNQYQDICTQGQQIRLNLNFNHPIMELLWAVRRRSQEMCNNHFNFSGKYGRDPVASVHLRLNNLSRFSVREGKYFRLVQPYQHHTNIPTAFVYCYSFALHPEEPVPTGSCNFSRIDNVEFIVDLQESLRSEEVKLIVIGRAWNVVRYRYGLAGIAFQS